MARELAEAEAKIERFAEAIAVAGNVPAVARRLQQAEERRQELVRPLQAIEAGPVVPRVDWRRVEALARVLLIGAEC